MQDRKKENRVVLHLVYYALVLVVEILVVILVFFAMMRCCQAGYQFCYEIFGPVSVGEKPGDKKVFRVGRSDTMYSVSKRLSEEGLIVNPYSFYVRTVLMERAKPSPGLYLLNTSMDYGDILDTLTAGG